MEGLPKKMAKLTLQDIEVNSIDQLIDQPSPAFKETLEKMLTDNNEEIARLDKLNKKILECLEMVDEQEQTKLRVVPGDQQNTSRVGLWNIIHINLPILKFQAPTCWPELPEKVWLRVLQNLPVKDVNNVHLVCRNLHQIANLHVNPKLIFKEDSPKDLESLVQSSRIFEELELPKGFGDHLLLPVKFELLEEYLGFTGPHIKSCSLKI
jgi:hypothetical protein